MNKGKKIKVALFSDILRENIDGVTYTLYNIIDRIPRDEFDYLFITAYPPDDRERVPFKVETCNYVRFPLYKDYPLALPFFNGKLEKALEEFQPDVIHFTTPALLGRYALKYGLKNNIPVFSTYHTHYLAYIDYYLNFIPGLARAAKALVRKITVWFYNQCDLTFVPTQPIKDELKDAGVYEDGMKIWGRGIDMDKFNPSFRDEEYMDNLCGKGTTRILFVSRLVDEKELKTLENVYKILEEKRPDVKMVITGDGPRAKRMQRRMPHAVFTGKLVGDDLARIYASSDLFLFPSITETFGNVVLEAMASGLPVVCAAQGGPMGIVQHGKTGYHAEPKNADDFYKYISTLLDDDDLFTRTARNAVAYARKQSWDALCEDMFDTYRSHFAEYAIAAAPEKDEERNEVAI